MSQSVEELELEMLLLKKQQIEMEAAILEKKLAIQKQKQGISSKVVEKPTPITGKGKEIASSSSETDPTPGEYKEALLKKKEVISLKEYEEDERSKPWFVVHTGPKFGIYRSLDKIKNIPSHYVLTAINEEDAKRTLAQVQEKRTRVPLFAKINGLSRQHEKLLSTFGAPSHPIEKEHTVLLKETVTKEEWLSLYHEVRSSCAEQGIIPVDRDDLIKGVLLPKIPSEKVKDLFLAGLVETMYPENKLEEIRYLSKIHQAATLYVQKCQLREKDKNVFFNVISSIPDWTEERNFPAYHLIIMGATGEDLRIPNPLRVDSSRDPIEEELEKYRLDGLYNIIKFTDKIDEQSHWKVNYCNSSTLMISYFNKKTGRKDLEIIKKWIDGLINNLQAKEETRAQVQDFRALVQEEARILKERKQGKKPVKGKPKKEIKAQDKQADGSNSQQNPARNDKASTSKAPKEDKSEQVVYNNPAQQGEKDEASSTERNENDIK